MQFLLKLAVSAIEVYFFLSLHAYFSLQLRHSLLLQCQLLSNQHLNCLYFLNYLSHLRLSLLTLFCWLRFFCLHWGGLIEFLNCHWLCRPSEQFKSVFSFGLLHSRFILTLAIEQSIIAWLFGEVSVHFPFEFVKYAGSCGFTPCLGSASGSCVVLYHRN